VVLAGHLLSAGSAAAPIPTPTPPPSTVPASAGSDSQQCGGITDPFCYVIDAFVSGPVAIMGSLDGSPDPAHIDPLTGAVTSGPWHLITTLVGTNPVVDNYDGSLGEPAHECGSSGCIPWVQAMNAILEPLSLALIVIAFALQVSLFMAGQQLNLRAGILPCLIAAAVLGAGLPLHLAGRVIDMGSWVSQGILEASFHRLGGSGAAPLDMMTVLAVTAYCPEDSPIIHPGIHLSLPGPSPRQQVLTDPWMDPSFKQSHCIGVSSPDFTKEVLDRSENFFGPPLHDANCDRGDASPGQPLCTNTDNQVNNNQGQNCLEGSGSSTLGSLQLGVLPLPGEPRAGDGQSPADCRYADIYWGTVPSFTDVWAGVGPHGRNGYDVPDGLMGMVAFTALTGLGLWLALTYLARFIVLSLLAACSSLAFVALALPGGRTLFNRYWGTVGALSAVVVVQTLIFLAFVAVVSTVSGLAPVAARNSCPFISPTSRSGCAAAQGGLLAEVGSGNPGDQFAKCLLAAVTVFLMVEVPGRISRGEMSTTRRVRALAELSAGTVLGGSLLTATTTLPRAGRYGARWGGRAAHVLGLPGRREEDLATRLESAGPGTAAGWPTVVGRESREQFLGRQLLRDGSRQQEIGRLTGLGPGDLAAIRSLPEGAELEEELRALGARYAAAGGPAVHSLDVAYLNALRRGRLRPQPGPARDQANRT
jgi:hypothetical protein